MLSMALPFAFAWLLKAKERRERLLYALHRPAPDRRRRRDPEKDEHDRAAGLRRSSSSPTGRGRCCGWRRWRSSSSASSTSSPRARSAASSTSSRPGSVNEVDTTKDRVSDYDAIKPDLAAHPLIGRGYGSYDQKKHRILDNQYLALAIGVGLLGRRRLPGDLRHRLPQRPPRRPLGRPGRAPPALGARPRRSSSPPSPGRCSTSSPSPSSHTSSASSPRSPSCSGATAWSRAEQA